MHNMSADKIAKTLCIQLVNFIVNFEEAVYENQHEFHN